MFESLSLPFREGLGLGFFSTTIPIPSVPFVTISIASDIGMSGVRNGRFSAKATDRSPDVTMPYLRAVEYLFTDYSKYRADSPAGARAILPIPFFYPSQDKV